MKKGIGTASFSLVFISFELLLFYRKAVAVAYRTLIIFLGSSFFHQTQFGKAESANCGDGLFFFSAFSSVIRNC